MIPPTVTHQQKAVRIVKGKPVFYEPPELAAAREMLTAHLAKHRPAQQMTGAVQLVVKWCFPITSGHCDGEYKTTKPDVDNLQKLLQDVMTKLRFWIDDAIISSLVVEKFWAATPGIYIAIQSLEDE